MKEEGVNIAIAIFGNRNENEKNIPHFQEQEWRNYAQFLAMGIWGRYFR